MHLQKIHVVLVRKFGPMSCPSVFDVPTIFQEHHMMARVADSRQSHERLLNVTHRRFQDALVLLVTPHLAVLLSLAVNLSCGHVLYATSTSV